PVAGVPTTPGGLAPNQRGQLMHETLLTAEWKKVLGASPPPDAGRLTKKLEGYAKLKGKADAEDEAQALQEINVLALSLKKKLAKDAKVVGHLDKMAKDALDAKKKVEADAAKEEAEAAKAGKDLPLVKMLARAVALPPQTPLYYAVALGKLSGLVIAKMIGGAHKEQAAAARTRNNGKKVGGKLMLGRCYGEQGKVVFETGVKPEASTKPPAGLAANLKKSIQKQTAGASKVKVLVRGGGVDLDEDADTGELTDFGPEATGEDHGAEAPPPPQAPPPQPTPQAKDQAAHFAAKLKALAPALKKILAANTPHAHE